MLRFLSLVLLLAGCTAPEAGLGGYTFGSGVVASCPDGLRLPDDSTYDCTKDEARPAKQTVPAGWTCTDRVQMWTGHLEIWRRGAEVGVAWSHELPTWWPEASTILAGVTIGEGEARQTQILRTGPQGFASMSGGLEDGTWLRFDLIGYHGEDLGPSGLTWDNVTVLARDHRSSIWPNLRLTLPEEAFVYPQSYVGHPTPEGVAWYVGSLPFSGTRPDGVAFTAQVDAHELALPRVRGYYEAPAEDPMDALRDPRTCPEGLHGPTAI